MPPEAQPVSGAGERAYVANWSAADSLRECEDLLDGQDRPLCCVLVTGTADAARILRQILSSSTAVMSTARSSRYALAVIKAAPLRSAATALPRRALP